MTRLHPHHWGPRELRIEVLTVGVPVVAVLLAAPGPLRFSLAAGLAGCAVLPLRHRWPRLTVLGALPGLVGGLGWPAAVIALYGLGRWTGQLRPALPFALLTAVAAVVPVWLTQNLDWPELVLTVVTALLYSGAPSAVGMLVTTREQLESSLRALESAREATLAAREEAARASERARIGREIHDAVGHHATMIAVGAAALAATTDDEETRETANRLRTLAKRALAEMRATLGLLGSAPEIETGSGIAAIPELVARTRATGMHVDLIGADTPTNGISPGVERTIYRLIQESLTNAAKHAPGSDVQVLLERRAAEVRVTVTNSRPPRPRAVTSRNSGGGLVGLAERIGMMGGRLRARPLPKGGFEVQGRLPVPPMDTKVASNQETNAAGDTDRARAH